MGRRRPKMGSFCLQESELSRKTIKSTCLIESFRFKNRKSLPNFQKILFLRSVACFGLSWPFWGNENNYYVRNSSRNKKKYIQAIKPISFFLMIQNLRSTNHPKLTSFFNKSCLETQTTDLLANHSPLFRIHSSFIKNYNFEPENLFCMISICFQNACIFWRDFRGGENEKKNLFHESSSLGAYMMQNSVCYDEKLSMPLRKLILTPIWGFLPSNKIFVYYWG